MVDLIYSKSCILIPEKTKYWLQIKSHIDHSYVRVLFPMSPMSSIYSSFIDLWRRHKQRRRVVQTSRSAPIFAGPSPGSSRLCLPSVCPVCHAPDELSSVSLKQRPLPWLQSVPLVCGSVRTICRSNFCLLWTICRQRLWGIPPYLSKPGDEKETVTLSERWNAEISAGPHFLD